MVLVQFKLLHICLIKYSELKSDLENVDEDKLIKYIKQEIVKLSKSQLEELKKDDNFLDWIIIKITEFYDNGIDEGYGDNSKKTNNYLIDSDFSSPFYGIASTNNFYPKKAAPGVEEKWLFNQGFKKIKNVSRGFYLNSIQENRENLLEESMENEEEYTLLPIPLLKEEDHNEYNIYLENFIINPTGAKLDAYFYFKDPNSGQEFVMEAENISWGAGGFLDSIRLKLLSTVEIRLSNSAMMILKQQKPKSC